MSDTDASADLDGAPEEHGQGNAESQAGDHDDSSDYVPRRDFDSIKEQLGRIEADRVAERREKQQLLAALAAREPQARQPEPDPYERFNREAAEGQLTAQSIAEISAHAAKQAVNEGLRTQLGPVLSAAEASSSIDPSIASDAIRHVMSDPKLREVYQGAINAGSPAAAASVAELAWKAHQAEASMHQRHQEVTGARETARRDAQIAGSQTNAARGKPEGTSEQQAKARKARLDRALETGRRTGNFRQYASEALSGKLRIWPPGEMPRDVK